MSAVSAVGPAARDFSTDPPPVSDRSLGGWLGLRKVGGTRGERDGEWAIARYTVKIEGQEFESTTLEQEQDLLKRVGDIVNCALHPVEIVIESEVMMASHMGAVKKLLGEHFAICAERDDKLTIGPKVVQEEDLRNGITRITYKNGQTRDVLQPYSAKDHPWVLGMLGEGLEIPAEVLEQLETALFEQPSNSSASMVIPLGGAAFKKGKNNAKTERRFEQSAKAKHVCHALKLDRLVVPSAKIVGMHREDTHYLFIAEQRLPVNADADFQETLYRKCSSEMDLVVQQLIRFIEETEISGISWLTIPLFEDGGVLKVALVGLEHVDTNRDIGLLGTGADPERGLLGCLFSESQIATVVRAAGGGPRAQKMQQQRLKELQWEERFIADPRRPIVIEGQLGLEPGDEEELTRVVKAINQAIQNSPHVSIRMRRRLILRVGELAEVDLDRLIMHQQHLARLARIGAALVQTGHLYEFKKAHNSYIFQA